VSVEVRERLSINKRTALKFEKGSFNLEKLNDVEVKEQYQVKICNKFGASENFDDHYVDISKGWECIRENKKFSHRQSRSL
jgi:hypothetical protein